MDVLVQMLGDHATVDLRLSLTELGRLDTAGKRLRRERADITLRDLEMPAAEISVRDCLAHVLGTRA